MELNERDRLVLQVLKAVNVCRSEELTWLSGFTDITYCRKRLQTLEKENYIKSYKPEVKHKYYTLTYKGQTELEYKGKVYEFNEGTEHTLGTTTLITWLYIQYGISIFDVKTDRQLRKLSNTKMLHRPDVLLQGTAYECERTYKVLKRVEKNIMDNERFDKQIWVVPDSKQIIRENIKKVIKKNMLQDVEILSFDRIREDIKNADIHSNVMRNHKMLPDIEPVVNDTEFDDKFSKYQKRRK
ncbi:MAG: hypothetical protein PHX08_06705 [Lachnospiraceae bacterium]|nr:hypothetical protein [Lachnospiraceae bacterium]